MMFNQTDRNVLALCAIVTVIVFAAIVAKGLADSVNTWQHPNDPSTDNYVQPTTGDATDLLDGTLVVDTSDALGNGANR